MPPHEGPTPRSEVMRSPPEQLPDLLEPDLPGLAAAHAAPEALHAMGEHEVSLLGFVDDGQAEAVEGDGAALGPGDVQAAAARGVEGERGKGFATGRSGAAKVGVVGRRGAQCGRRHASQRTRG